MINCWKSPVHRYRYLSVTFLSLFFIFESQAQNSVGIGTATPNPNAVLDLKSDQQGFLVPALSSSQRYQMADALSTSSGNDGMIVFDKDAGKFYYWLGNEWKVGLGAFNNLGAGGDLSGAYPTPTVVAIQGNPVAAIAPGDNQILQWDGNAWKPADPFTPGKGVNIADNRIINTGDVNPDDDVLKSDIAGGDVVGTFDNLQLNPNSVSTSEISDGSITSDKIADANVGTSKIADNAVTLDKINGGSGNGILTTDDNGNPAWLNKESFANDKTNQQGLLIGDGSDITGINGTADQQILKWDSGELRWKLGQDNDNQQLSLSGNQLLLEGGSSVDLTPYKDNTDNQGLANVLTEGNNAGGVAIQNLADPASPQDAATKNYVDVLDAADGDKDAENELITGAALNGNSLEMTEGGATTVVDLSIFNNQIAGDGINISGNTINTKVDGSTIGINASQELVVNDDAISTSKIVDNAVTDQKIVSMAYEKLLQGSANTNDVLQWNGLQWIAAAIAAGTTTTVTSYGSIDPVSFERAGYSKKAEIEYPGEADYAQINGGSTGVAFSPLYIPHNAVIEEVRVYLYDNEAADDITAYLVKKPLNGTSSTNFFIGKTSGTPGHTEVFLSLNETVDNSAFTYRFRIEGKDQDGHRIYGARISYTETVSGGSAPNGSRMGGAINIGDEPSDPQPGMLWMNEDGGDEGTLEVWNGSDWDILIYSND